MVPRTILLCGSSGMIGKEILNLCLSSYQIKKIHLLVRRPITVKEKKVSVHLISDFSKHSIDASYLQNIDAVFFCIGVYTGTVSRALFSEVTVDYPLALAKTLKKVKSKAKFILLSGAGADPSEKSRMMFAKYKGVVENRLRAENLASFHSFRPAYIYPVQKRKEPQFSYQIARWLYPFLKFLGKKYSIPSTMLAKAMLKIALKGSDEEIFENKQIWKLLSEE